MAGITTHILDTAQGRPAAGVAVALEFRDGEEWRPISSGTTNQDGRIMDLTTGKTLTAGVYRLVFNTGDYLEANHIPGFYPFVPVVFRIDNPEQHFHVPLLLSPFGYSTYRGS